MVRSHSYQIEFIDRYSIQRDLSCCDMRILFALSRLFPIEIIVKWIWNVHLLNIFGMGCINVKLLVDLAAVLSMFSEARTYGV